MGLSLKSSNQPTGAGGASDVCPHVLALPFDESMDPHALRRAVLPWLARFGFDSASYFVTVRSGGVVSGDMLWTTLPGAWSTCYARESHVALDPRLTPTRRHLAPFLWDAAHYADDWRVQRFLADARRHGIAGGLVISLHDSPARWVTVTFDVGAERLQSTPREAFAMHLGEMALIAIALHGCIVTWPPARRRVDRAQHGLSFRERDCLSMAAHGLTSADIGERLCVAERTVNFHFRNIKSKLGAINRPEAIARGISLGILNSDGD
jgi:DNA-binding CsgD family transcriptional regulator